MISMENTVEPNNQIVENQQINKDLQFEVIIEKDTIHDLKSTKAPQRLRREILFPKRRKNFIKLLNIQFTTNFLEDPTTLA
jgi:hypothetical protein